MSERFVRVEVEPGPAHEDGLSLRFKRVGDARAVSVVPYASEAGLEGPWRALAVDDPEGDAHGLATAVRVEDSSDGEAWLILGGRYGLVLVHEATGVTERVPYLLLAAHARVL